MQSATGGGTGAGDIAAILRDLRFHQYNIEHDFHLWERFETHDPGIRAACSTIVPQKNCKINAKIAEISTFHSIHQKNISLGANLWILGKKLHKGMERGRSEYEESWRLLGKMR